jgi:putative membrane protein
LLAAITAGGWTIAETSAQQAELAFALTGYAVVQLVLFGVVALVTSLAPVRRAVTPRFLKRHRVKKAAFHHFAAAHARAHESGAAVLIFVALVERQVEVLADAAIHAKVGEAVWRAAAAAVQEAMKAPDPTAGIVQAVGLCGEALKAHFPDAERRLSNHRPIDD